MSNPCASPWSSISYASPSCPWPGTKVPSRATLINATAAGVKITAILGSGSRLGGVTADRRRSRMYGVEVSREEERKRFCFVVVSVFAVISALRRGTAACVCAVAVVLVVGRLCIDCGGGVGFGCLDTLIITLRVTFRTKYYENL
ncbi:hypothetical protein IWX50DRAFT_617409 [Phyllosticta citricarpa]